MKLERKRRDPNRIVYYIIAVVDAALGTLAFGSLGHILIVQGVLGLFGSAMTLGRIQAWKQANAEPRKSPRRILLFITWGLGVFMAAFLVVSFDLAVIQAQSVEAAVQNSVAEGQKLLVQEHRRLLERIPKLETTLAEAVDKGWKNTRASTESELSEARDRLKTVETELKKEAPAIAVSAESVFSQIFGKDFVPIVARLFLAALSIFMDLFLALFTKPAQAQQLVEAPKPEAAPDILPVLKAQKLRTRRVKQYESREAGFVKVLWTSYRNDRSKLITTRNYWDKWWATHGGFPEAEYKRLLELAKTLKLIAEDGTILIGDEDLAIDMLKRGGMAT